MTMHAQSDLPAPTAGRAPASAPGHSLRRRRGRISALLVGVAAAATIGLTLVSSVAAATPATAGGAVEPVADSPATFCGLERETARQTPTLETLKALGDCEIERRLQALDRLDAAVAAAPVITTEHKRLLRYRNDTNPASFEATREGLERLKATIDAETDLASLRREVGQIATDFRVYLLVAPKALLVRGADAVTAATERFGQLEDELQVLIDRADAAGKDTTAAKAALAAMTSKVSQAASLAAPLPGELLPLSVAEYNDGIAGPELRSARADIGAARDLLRGARADARQVINLLRG
jgi:hypothetical protein